VIVGRVELDAPAVGGEVVGRCPDGRVVFVAGGAPGDVADVELVEERKRFARGRIAALVVPSPDRVAPPCPHVAEGCGGCDWQHLDLDAQRRHRRRLVRDVLARQGGVADPVVQPGPEVPVGARTTVRGVADGAGRFSFRRRRSHEPVPIERCLVAHPLVDEVIRAGRFPAGAEVTVRAGARTGERLVVVGADGPVEVPDGVTVVTAAELAAGRRAWFHEEVAGRRWRVSAPSFFQASVEGAEALLSVVGDAIERHRPDATRLVDLCAGVGLFAGALGEGRRVVAVERSRSSVADARVNLADRDARILEVPVASWRPGRADVVVADPARRGLERAGADAVAATGADLCVLVNCDVGALGRDALLLADVGYRHAGSTALDLFAHTGQVEVVSTFLRA